MFNLNDEQLDALKKLGINPIDNNTFPKEGEYYYFISTRGIPGKKDPNVGKCPNVDDTTDKFNISIGNIFKTAEDVEFEIERLKVIAKMRKYADSTLNSGYFIDYYWGENYGIEDNKLTVNYSRYHKLTDMLFKTYKDATTCIDEVGAENIIRYYFRVDI